MLENILNKIKEIDKRLTDDCGISLDHVAVRFDENCSVDTYHMTVSEALIEISAQDEAHLFYGVLDLLKKVKTREIIKNEVVEDIKEQSSLTLKERDYQLSLNGYQALIRTLAYHKIKTLEVEIKDENFEELSGYAQNYYVELSQNTDIKSNNYFVYDKRLSEIELLKLISAHLSKGKERFVSYKI